MIDYIPIILQSAGLLAGAAWLYLFITDAVREEENNEREVE